jgi:hypothetical protein
LPTQTGPVWKYDELQIACGWEVKVSRSTRQHFCVHLDSGEIQQRAAPACAWRGTRRRGGAEDCCKVLEAVEVPVAEHKGLVSPVHPGATRHSQPSPYPAAADRVPLRLHRAGRGS